MNHFYPDGEDEVPEILRGKCDIYENKCLFKRKCKVPPSQAVGSPRTCKHDFQCGSVIVKDFQTI